MSVAIWRDKTTGETYQWDIEVYESDDALRKFLERYEFVRRVYV